MPATNLHVSKHMRLKAFNPQPLRTQVFKIRKVFQPLNKSKVCRLLTYWSQIAQRCHTWTRKRHCEIKRAYFYSLHQSCSILRFRKLNDPSAQLWATPCFDDRIDFLAGKMATLFSCWAAVAAARAFEAKTTISKIEWKKTSTRTTLQGGRTLVVDLAFPRGRPRDLSRRPRPPKMRFVIPLKREDLLRRPEEDDGHFWVRGGVLSLREVVTKIKVRKKS